jgi:hypothetical protein
MVEALFMIDRANPIYAEGIANGRSHTSRGYDVAAISASHAITCVPIIFLKSHFAPASLTF